MSAESFDELLKKHRFVAGIAEEWAKDQDPNLLLVLRDWCLERGIEPEPVVEELKRHNYQRIRRENLEEVLHENGNLETEPLKLKWLSHDAPTMFFADIQVDSPHGKATVKVSVPVNAPALIQSVHYPTGERHTPKRNVYRGTAEYWPEFAARVPFEIDERQVLRAAQTLAEHESRQVPWIGLDGEVFYESERVSSFGLWMEYAPEYLQRELDREVNLTTGYRTLYTDGGGYQDALPPAFVDAETNELWQQVHSGAYNPETECPFKDYDVEHQEDERGRLVSDFDTLYGEAPHKRCRYCDADIGEKHGYVYVGEGGEYVYVQVPEPEEEEEEEDYPAVHEERFPAGTLFVAAEEPLDGDAYTLDLRNTYSPDGEGNYTHPNIWQDALVSDWDVSDVHENEFGDEVGTVELDGRRLKVWTWEI